MIDSAALLLLIKGFKDGQFDELTFYQYLTRLITKELACSRASLWLYTDTFLNEITCLNLFDSDHQKNFQEIRLHEEDFAPYFEAMRNDGGIDAPYAMEHPATSCFNADYFEPNDILSLLDVGIRYKGQLVGVFCCENVATPMEWSQEQKDYLAQAGKLITFAMKPKIEARFSALIN